MQTARLQEKAHLRPKDRHSHVGRDNTQGLAGGGMHGWETAGVITSWTSGGSIKLAYSNTFPG